LNSEFPYHIKEKDGFSRFYEIFPNSSLIHYKLALFPKVNQKKLKELLKKETSFHETYYFLGEIELMLGKLISAEKNFLKANKNFPRPLSIMLPLAISMQERKNDLSVLPRKLLFIALLKKKQTN